MTEMLAMTKRIAACTGLLAVLGATGLVGQDFRWQGAVDRGDAVTIRGVNGSIVARAGGSQVSVQATKTSRDDDPSTERLDIPPGRQG